MSSPEGPPPPPDPRRVLSERVQQSTGGTPFTPPTPGEDEVEAEGGDGGGPDRRTIALIIVSALALGLGVAVAFLVAAGPKQVVKTRTTTSTTKSVSTTISTNTDVCQWGVGNFLPCTRTCATGLGGDLFCGTWGGPRPPQLTLVPEPASDHYLSWNQTDVGPNHVCSVNSQRDIWCFGMNEFGQFGTGAVSTARTDEPTVPVNRFPNGIATLAFP